MNKANPSLRDVFSFASIDDGDNQNDRVDKLESGEEKEGLEESSSNNNAHPLLASRGKDPSGTMMVNLLLKNQCPGFPTSKGVISICYTIPNGMQLSFHDRNPGIKYDGFPRRLFELDYQTRWSTIPNKTSLRGGRFVWLPR